MFGIKHNCMGNRDRAQNGQWARTGVPVVVYYCRTYVLKAVRGGGSEEGGRVLWDATSRRGSLCGRLGLGPPRTKPEPGSYDAATVDVEIAKLPLSPQPDPLCS